jgi:ATP-dependent DNA ligase
MKHGSPAIVSKTTLYQRTRIGKTQVWSIWVETQDTTVSGHPEVWIEHGQVDGKKQLTNDIISEGVNVGKANETTPFQQAVLTLERKVVKQKEKGYSEDLTDVEVVSDKAASISFREPLPKELCFYKPKNSIEDKKIAQLEANKSAIFTVKRDGMMHVVRKSKKFGVEIYSRRMDLVTDKYPHLVKELNEIPCDELIMLGEIILDKDGKDDFNGVSQICRSDAEKAAEKQKELGLVSYYIFDLAYLEGQNLLSGVGYADRLKFIDDSILPYVNQKHVMRCETLDMNHKKALDTVKKRKLEGLVVWDSKGTMGDNEAFTMNGKAYRPNVLWKSKPKYEDDFIVRFDPDSDIGEYGSGKNNGKLKSAHLYQLDDDGKEVFLAKCGGGLSDDQRDFYTKAKYPRVWRVEYDSIQSKTGSLRFPVFNADRTLIGDKTTKECLMSDAIKHAREQEEEENE